MKGRVNSHDVFTFSENNAVKYTFLSMIYQEQLSHHMTSVLDKVKWALNVLDFPKNNNIKKLLWSLSPCQWSLIHKSAKNLWTRVASTPRTQKISHIANHFVQCTYWAEILLSTKLTTTVQYSSRVLIKIADLPNSVERKIDTS